ncbi:MAG: twin-arginine translocation signal domain-containing protein [Phascolarctobacterium sp.]
MNRRSFLKTSGISIAGLAEKGRLLRIKEGCRK